MLFGILSWLAEIKERKGRLEKKKKKPQKTPTFFLKEKGEKITPGANIVKLQCTKLSSYW